jgi:flavin reductase (DIM6/NTAB) family NADH-FMN oxidoreductase RutF
VGKILLPADTTLYPVPVVLITCGRGPQANVFTLNRIASCNAEPPMVSISVRLPSHSLFIAEVVALHAEESALDERGEVDLDRVRGGLPYRAEVVRERPVENFRPEELLRRVKAWRDR